MWLDASAGTDSAGANPIKAMSAQASARRGLRAILFIVYLLWKISVNILNRTYRTHRTYRSYESYEPYCRILPGGLNKFQSLEPNPFSWQQRERGLGRFSSVNLRLSVFAGLGRDRGGVQVKPGVRRAQRQRRSHRLPALSRVAFRALRPGQGVERVNIAADCQCFFREPADI